MELLAEIAAKGLTPEQLAQIPRTKEQLAAARLRLQSPSTPSQCSICGDGGIVHPRKGDGTIDYSKTVDCKCVAAKKEQALQERYLKMCELPVATEHRTIENFKTHGIADLIEAKQAALDFIDGKVIFLSLIGDVDHGKTHLAIALCRKWLEQKKSAKYVMVPLMLKDLRDGYELRGEDSYKNKFEFYMKVGLLALDDLGVERHKMQDQTEYGINDWSMEQLETIVDYRYIQGLPTVITTNKNMIQLNDFSPRIRSRMARDDGHVVIGIASPEYMKIKKTGGKK